MVYMKYLLIGDTIFTTLKFTETFHMTDRQIHTHTCKHRYVCILYVDLMSLSEKTKVANCLRISEERQHLYLNYFKILSVALAGN